MHSVTNFTIEIGSQLELIEYYGLHCIGYYLNDRTDSGSFSPSLKNLILPHTLKNVSNDGIQLCTRFTRIIYCGNHNLNQNSSNLEGSSTDIKTKVYITQEYQTKNGNSIFKREASGVLSEDKFDISCSGMLPQPTPAPSSTPSPLSGWLITDGKADGVNVTGWRSGSGERCPTGGIEIPERVNGKTVVGVSERAFENCSVRGLISLAQTVQEVGGLAFANTSDVEGIRLPFGLKSVGEGAFENCSGPLGDPSLVALSSANIGEGAFKDSGISEVVFA